MPRPAAPGSARAVLVTGCSSGIGEATARRLLGQGWAVWATARDPASLTRPDGLQDAGARVLRLDVTDPASRVAAVEAVLEEHGAVAALVNNAGYGEYGPVEEVPLERWRAQFETNVFGAVGLTQLVLPGMRALGWGRVVNVSSMGGRFTLPGGGAYHSSKYALEAFSDALRLEVRNFGIRVSLVEPGPVLTPWSTGAVSTAVGAAEDGPYGQFRLELAASVAGAYKGGRFSMVSSPDRVAATVQRAVSSARPRARYLVGPAARGLVVLKRVLPDAAFDALLSMQFPVPGKGAPESGM